MSSEVKELKDLAAKTIEEIHPLLVDTAKTIHAFAEIMYQEYKSSKLLADRLVEMGFEVERGADDFNEFDHPEEILYEVAAYRTWNVEGRINQLPAD